MCMHIMGMRLWLYAQTFENIITDNQCNTVWCSTTGYDVALTVLVVPQYKQSLDYSNMEINYYQCKMAL